MTPKRLLVTGSRDWTDHETIRKALRQVWDSWGMPGNAILVHGAARGADSLAAWNWARRGLPVEAHPADWKQYGKPAGIIRNKQMVDLGAHVCLAFPLGESRGTRHCMSEAKKAGIEVRVWFPGATTWEPF